MEYCGICPNCGSKLIKKNWKFGTFIGCSNFPKCRFSMDYKPENVNLNFKNLNKCPNCGSKLIKKNGSKGEFLSCSNFPQCKFSMNYKEMNDKREKNTCPKCGAPLIKKESKFGTFLGCSKFPKCKFTKNINSTNKNYNKVKNENSNYESTHFQDDKYKSKVKLAKEFVLTNLGINIKELLILKKWDEDIELCMNILNDNVTYENKKYIESILGYAYHRRDKRNSLEYACDLIVGWVIEDCIVEILNKLGYDTSLNSADKHRKILLKPTANSDLKVYNNGKDILIEQVNDFTGYWKKTLHVPLRDNKYKNLKNENSLLFGIDYVNKLFFILNVPKTKANYIPYHRPFGKPAYAILITDNDFHDLNRLEIIISDILSQY